MNRRLRDAFQALLSAAAERARADVTNVQLVADFHMVRQVVADFHCGFVLVALGRLVYELPDDLQPQARQVVRLAREARRPFTDWTLDADGGLPGDDDLEGGKPA